MAQQLTDRVLLETWFRWALEHGGTLVLDLPDTDPAVRNLDMLVKRTRTHFFSTRQPSMQIDTV